MELLAPAGNLEKMNYAFQWGADAVYAGFGGFSLRTKAEALSAKTIEEYQKIRKNKKVYGVFNVYLYQQDAQRLEEKLEEIKLFNYDAFIISDMGALSFFRRHFPNTPLHLSTQANCLNAEAAKVYRDLGFSRIILGREASLNDIQSMKKALPDMELEVFVHGAMCLAYSGRCFLSRWMAGKERSANQGACSHTCRWNFRVLEESQRPGEYYPIEEGDGWTTILSSQDLCLIDHLQKLKDSGIDSIKIEGRMKSLYYTALTVRAYRYGLQELERSGSTVYPEFRDELFRINHRKYTAGFLFDKEGVQQPYEGIQEGESQFCALIQDSNADGSWNLDVRQPIKPGEVLEFLSPTAPTFQDDQYIIKNQAGEVPLQADHMKIYTLQSAHKLQEGMIIRKASQSGSAPAQAGL